MRFETQNIFFTSDFHLFHDKVLIHDKRPFDTIDQMHDTIISNWNDKVSENDIVFYLGDLSFVPNKTELILNQLNGKIYFIKGNHDKIKDITKLNRFEKIYDFGTDISILDKDGRNKGNKDYQNIVLCHYPLLIWNKHHHGAWHIHGHCHHNLIAPDFYKRRVIDIGCNGHDYTPLSYVEIKEIMLNKEVVLIDHINKK